MKKIKIITGLFVLWVSLSGFSGCGLETGDMVNGSNALRNDEYVKGEILVRFKDEVSMERIGDINKAIGTEIIRTFSSGRLFLLHFPEGFTVIDMMERYKELPEVKFAEPNYKVKIQ